MLGGRLKVVKEVEKDVYYKEQISARLCARKRPPEEENSILRGGFAVTASFLLI